MSEWRERLDAFPTQLVMTILWGTVGMVLCIIFRSILLWVALMSAYANTISHFTAHIAWRAKRKAQQLEKLETDNANREDVQMHKLSTNENN